MAPPVEKMRMECLDHAFSVLISNVIEKPITTGQNLRYRSSLLRTERGLLARAIQTPNGPRSGL